MILKHTMTTLSIIVLAGVFVGSFWFSRSKAIASWNQDNPSWLSDAPADIIQTEQEFTQWIKGTKQLLKSQRFELSELLQNPQSTDIAILAQTDKIAATQADLLSGVCKHIKFMQTSLPQTQKELLKGYCGQCRQGCGHCQDNNTTTSNTHGHGHSGMEKGNGFQHGNKRRYCGLTRRLQLTENQLAISQEKDPGFENDIQKLRTSLFTERQNLIAMINGEENPNQELTKQCTRLIDAYNSLEKRLINHILIMRPYFAKDQLMEMTGMCKNNCSGDNCHTK